MKSKTFPFHKPEPNATLEYLTPEQDDALVQWLVSGRLTYVQILTKLRNEFKIAATVRALVAFYRKNVVPYLVRRRQNSVYLALGMTSEIEKQPANFYDVAMDALLQKTLNACVDHALPPKELKIFLDLTLRWNDQKIRSEEVKLKLRRLDFLEQREKKLTETFGDTRLSSEQIAERLRSIFKPNGSTEPNTTETQTATLHADRLPA